MRFTASSLSLVGGSLATPTGNSQALWRERRGILLRIEAGDLAGLGEASPLPGYSPDVLGDCERALRDVHTRISPLDLSLPPDDAVTASLAPLAEALGALPAARFALETALLDLLARWRGVSIATLLGGAGRRVALSHLLDAGADDWRARLASLLERDVRAVKVKLGRRAIPWADELARLEEIREALGPDRELRLDANGCFSLAEARARLAALGRVAPSFVEQPVSGLDTLALGRCAVGWAADESLSLPAVRAQICAAEGCVALILKPALLGFLPARSLAIEAQRAGLGVVVTHMFDGPVALAAACALALSLPSAPLACGLASHEALGAFLPAADARSLDGAWLSPHDDVGLGARELR